MEVGSISSSGALSTSNYSANKPAQLISAQITAAEGHSYGDDAIVLTKPLAEKTPEGHAYGNDGLVLPAKAQPQTQTTAAEPAIKQLPQTAAPSAPLAQQLQEIPAKSEAQALKRISIQPRRQEQLPNPQIGSYQKFLSQATQDLGRFARIKIAA